jgi:hypothetical protein
VQCSNGVDFNVNRYGGSIITARRGCPTRRPSPCRRRPRRNLQSWSFRTRPSGAHKNLAIGIQLVKLRRPTGNIRERNTKEVHVSELAAWLMARCGFLRVHPILRRAKRHRHDYHPRAPAVPADPAKAGPIEEGRYIRPSETTPNTSRRVTAQKAGGGVARTAHRQRKLPHSRYHTAPHTATGCAVPQGGADFPECLVYCTVTLSDPFIYAEC